MASGPRFCEFGIGDKCSGREVEVVLDGEYETCLCERHIAMLERECKVEVVGEVFV